MSEMHPLALYVPLAPLAGALVAGFFGRAIGRAGAHWVTSLGVAVSLLLSWFMTRNHPDAQLHPLWPLVIPITLVIVVTSGAITGSLLPLMFKRLGLDPALMSNPFVAGISDILGIVIYMTVSMTLLAKLSGH